MVAAAGGFWPQRSANLPLVAGGNEGGATTAGGQRAVGPLPFGDVTPAAALPDRVERQADALARAMVAEFVQAIPTYATLPGEQLQGEIREVIVANLRALLRCLREGRTPEPAELDEIRASASRRAEERVPLEAILTAYITGARLGWQALRDEAGEHESAELHGYVPLVLAYLGSVVSAVTSAWVEEQQAIVGEERDARRALTEALLTGGRAATSLVERAGVEPAERYRALAIHIGLSPDERRREVSGAVAGRRKIRRVVQALERWAGGPVLTLLEIGGGAAVIATDDVAEVHRVIAEAADAEVWVAHSDLVRLPAIPDAWAEVREVRRLVRALRRPPGAYGIDDVVLEYTLTTDPAVVARLQDALAPIADRPDLLETLDAWYGSDFDRRATATALTIHPNTLDYRLRRITELVGHDVTSATGMQLLGAALIARRLAPGQDR